MATESELENTDDVSCFLNVDPNRAGLTDLLKYAAWGDTASGALFLESSDEAPMREAVADHRWIIVVSVIVRKILTFFAKPMEWTGFLVDFILNLLSINGDFFGLLFNLFHGKVVIPHRGTETFISTIGHLDGRIDLYRCESPSEDGCEADKLLNAELGNRALIDFCMMSSKLSYENEKVVRNVVNLHWKMHFVDFYNCWNDYQKQHATQVFIQCDKSEDANLIIIAFRGTEPFDADDWCTDFDYSWYDIPDLGRVHMGFLEALGLGNRTDTATFRNNLINQMQNNEDIEPIMGDKSAYYTVRAKLKMLLEEHKKTKFIVTGHSLGGALAVLFPTVLLYHKETQVMDRLLGVYTFGQPRVGDRRFRSFMEGYLHFPSPRYFRVVYCNDIVPRLPYDDTVFLYKHFGVCIYYDSMYNERKVEEEPNKNFFSLRSAVAVHLNGVWELIRGLTMGYVYGPDYKEGWFSILFRVVGVALPGISAHCPTNYVTSIRLGKLAS